MNIWNATEDAARSVRSVALLSCASLRRGEHFKRRSSGELRYCLP